VNAWVLGSAAGGGFPQWNCGCPQCAGVRQGRPGLQPRTQESLAVVIDGRCWLFNASPDIRVQLSACAALWPSGSRSTPIVGVILTNGDVDHVAGLLSLREDQPLELYATRTVLAQLIERNVLLRTLRRFPEQLLLRELPVDGAIELGSATLSVTAVPGKLPVHLEGVVRPELGSNIGLRLERYGRSLAYFPGVGAITAEVKRALAADVLLFDGTFWDDDELARRQCGTRTARDMAHTPIGGTNGSLAQLRGVPARRRLFTHVNNTNPVLDEHSPERRAVVAAGWQVACDGMELSL
jgi:pyrroloquinoline quinone biosynthesis protein B